MHLNVYFNDDKAGELKQEEKTARLSFRYDSDYVAKNGAPLSLTLPVRDDLYDDHVATPFFASLLPEETMRKNLARNLGTSEENVFALLEKVGRECAGAISFYPENEQPPLNRKPRLILLQEKQLADILDNLRQTPLLQGMSFSEQDGVRLSLAGAQAKLPVGVLDKTICLVTDGAPTTHIIKPKIPDLDEIVENEFFCMRLAQMVGLPVAKVALRQAQEKKYLLAERYDRAWDKKSKRVVRLHQEDFCQALGIPPQKKYEKDGGPGLNACIDLIKRHSRQPARDYKDFLQLVIFNYFIGNSDAHGKNFSFLYHDRKISLAPAYDLLCTAVYPHLTKNMAMKIGGHYDPDIIVRRHWSELVSEGKTAQNFINNLLSVLAHLLPQTASGLKDTLAKDGITSPVFDKIIAVVRERTLAYQASQDT